MAEVLERVNSFLEPLLEGTDMFVVNLKVKPINNIKIFLDADSGISIEKCIRINRKLYHAIEEAQMFPEGDFSLEVSSPGVDEPLAQWRQYKKNVGRTVLVTLVAEDRELLGVLTDVNEERIVLEVTTNPKKKETTIMEIPFSEIKTTVVQIIF